MINRFFIESKIYRLRLIDLSIESDFDQLSKRSFRISLNQLYRAHSKLNLKQIAKKMDLFSKQHETELVLWSRGGVVDSRSEVPWLVSNVRRMLLSDPR